ncbi:hypothetical protein [Streptomyces sp. NBC_01465]|uniref:hypothetical protein n=1 Tax=Streptomyces sp. NBC_01465 TaxID=2903878 RepID=UPI002E2F97D7|nr:hypothetical protein [Streptomyces sp. NBC_01465]
MRIPRRIAAVAASALLLTGAVTGTAAAASHAAPASDAPCKTRTGGAYLSPFGHADVTLKPEALAKLKQEHAEVGAVAPLSMNRPDQFRFPLGFMEDSIEPDLTSGLRVCYPGGITISRPSTHDEAVCDGVWLTVFPTAAWCNVRINGGPEKKIILAETTIPEVLLGSKTFHPVLLPRVDFKTGEFGYGPEDWEFRASKDFSTVLKTFGVDLPVGTPLFNLDATLSFLPGPDFWSRITGEKH